jgi:hypothetical protein
MTSYLAVLACLGVLAGAGALTALTVHVGRLTTAVAEHDQWHRDRDRETGPAAGTAADPITTAQRFPDGAPWIT